MAIRKTRGYTAKKRNSYTRNRRRFIVISAEGKNKTEKLYFKKFNNSNVSIKFTSTGSTDSANMTMDLVKYCQSLDFDSSLGDRSYCFVDADVNSKKDIQIAKADSIASDNSEYSISIIVSNPCFEEWFLCHFGYSTKQYVSSDEVIKDIKNKIPGYSKSQEDIFDLLYPYIDKAIDNAKKLEEYNVNAGRKRHTSDFQPSTEVYKVVEELR